MFSVVEYKFIEFQGLYFVHARNTFISLTIIISLSKRKGTKRVDKKGISPQSNLSVSIFETLEALIYRGNVVFFSKVHGSVYLVYLV